MARTATRRHKGCAMCKPYKDIRMASKDRKPWSELRTLGKVRGVTRHDLGDFA